MTPVGFLGRLMGAWLVVRTRLFRRVRRLVPMTLPMTMTLPVPMTLPVTSSATTAGMGMMLLALRRAAFANFGRCGLVHPGDRLANEPFDGADCLAVDRSDYGDCRARASGTSRATDAMHIVIRMMRDVEV